MEEADQQQRRVSGQASRASMGKISLEEDGGESLHSTEVPFLLLTQQPLARFPALPKFFLWNFSMLLGFSDGGALSKVDRGLKMFKWHASSTKKRLIWKLRFSVRLKIA